MPAAQPDYLKELDDAEATFQLLRMWRVLTVKEPDGWRIIRGTAFDNLVRWTDDHLSKRGPPSL